MEIQSPVVPARRDTPLFFRPTVQASDDKAQACLPEVLVLNPEGGKNKPEHSTWEDLEQTWLMQDPSAAWIRMMRISNQRWIIGIVIAECARIGSRFEVRQRVSHGSDVEEKNSRHSSESAGKGSENITMVQYTLHRELHPCF
jgi:hypothetical protein